MSIMVHDMEKFKREAYDHLLDLIVQEISAYGWVYKIMTRPVNHGEGKMVTERILRKAAELTRKRKAATALLYAVLIPGHTEATLPELIALLPRKEQQIWNRFRERLRITYTKAMESYNLSATDETAWRQSTMYPRVRRARAALSEG